MAKLACGLKGQRLLPEGFEKNLRQLLVRSRWMASCNTWRKWRPRARDQLKTLCHTFSIMLFAEKGTWLLTEWKMQNEPRIDGHKISTLLQPLSFNRYFYGCR
uniref:Uncharacterized protein n=1 Tax=Arundo donax TaxID=35708 RepID=A0A0A9GBY6_ARUDO